MRKIMRKETIKTMKKDHEKRLHRMKKVKKDHAHKNIDTDSAPYIIARVSPECVNNGKSVTDITQTHTTHQEEEVVQLAKLRISILHQS